MWREYHLDTPDKGESHIAYSTLHFLPYILIRTNIVLYCTRLYKVQINGHMAVLLIKQIVIIDITLVSHDLQTQN